MNITESPSTALPTGIRLVTAHGDLPAIAVSIPTATALVYLHGAHVAEWVPTAQAPVLWMSAHSGYSSTDALRGGIPLCFPWFGMNAADATLPNHGWARLAEWSLLNAVIQGDAAELTFELTEQSGGVPAGTAPLRLVYVVTIGAELTVDLRVENTADSALTFEEAFHTYLSIDDVTATSISGFEDAPFLDRTVTPELLAVSPLPVQCGGEQIDRVYPMPELITVTDAGNSRVIAVTATEAAQSVLWNPGRAKAAAIADFGDDEWTSMVCVEAANIREGSITLAPGTSHHMGVTLTLTTARETPKDQNDMQTLTRATHSVEAIAAGTPPLALPTRAIQFGEGNFLRGFVEWQLQQMNKQGLFNGGVTIVQPLPSGLIAAQAVQDDLFTVLLEGKLDGAEVQSHEVITVVTGSVDPYTDYAGYLALAENDDIEFIFSNTTEAGIAYNGDDTLFDSPQKSFPGKLTALLFRRFELGKAGFQIIPCELIEHNGDRLREIVLQLAALWNLGESFTRWVSDENTFYSSLVDRIVPGYPKDRAAQLALEFGYTDNFIVKAEPFLLWVIEGPQELVERLPLAQAGLNVIVTNDMTPYRERKVFLLNGPHTVMALLARLADVVTVREVMQDAEFGPLINEVMYSEIIPVLDLPHAELATYAESVKERFDNPFMHHELASIALNSVSKFTSRLLPILLATQRDTGALPPHITLALSALLLTYSGDAAVTFAPVDGDDVLEIFRAAATASTIANDEHTSYVETILADQSLWGTDLLAVPGLAAQVTAGLTSLRTRGVRASITDLI